nr:Rha family transcriptional regulator [uncultured Cellulosilyticum sp.]
MSQKLVNTLAQCDNTPVILNDVSNEVRITSVELVEMINTFRKEEGNTVEKEHKDLLKSIRTEIEMLEKAGIKGQGNFSPSSYINKQNKQQPCYLMNKAGALQMLNKESAVVRYKTVQYIENLEQALKEQQTLPQGLSPQLQFLINMELEQKKIQSQLNQVNHRVLEVKATAEQATKQMEIVKDAMLLDHDGWRGECNNIINKIAKEQRGGTKEAYKGVRDEVYKRVEQRAGANLKQRVINKQDRMRREGVSKSKVDKVSQIDIIAEDKRLKEIYIAIVKEMAIKYGVNQKGA